MSRESVLGREVIHAQFDELAAVLDAPTTVFLIGGGALTLQELKNATKDIDLIVTSTDAAGRLFDALRAIGYRPPDDLAGGYEQLGTAYILQKGHRRFDVFNQQVAGVVVLSDAMRDRSQRLFTAGPLSVRMVSLNDIFLFKSVANREDDIDDMVVLAEAGLDVDLIIAEVMRQLEILRRDQFIGAMKHKLDRLAARGYSFDIMEEVAVLYDRAEEAKAVSDALFSLFDADYRRNDLYEGVPPTHLSRVVSDEIDVDGAIQWLEQTDRVRRASDGSLIPTIDP